MRNTSYQPSMNIFVIVLSVGFLVAGCDGPSKPPEPSPLQVSVVTVQPRVLTLTSELPGRTAPLRIAEIRPQVNGLILKRLFTEGAEVKAGQMLYQIDPTPFQAVLDNARATLNRAESNLPSVRSRAERFSELLASKAVSQQDYDDAAGALKQVEADIASWRAQVESARINLGYTAIKAPISGRIGKSSVTEGAIVTAYQPAALATIQQLDPIYVDVPQSTSDLLRLKRRMEAGNLSHDGKSQSNVELILEDGSSYNQPGNLQFRDISVDPSTGSVNLRMVFPNPSGTLLPEMFVRAKVTEGVNKQAILVPQQAVMRNPKGEPYAMVVENDSKVGMRMLTLEREDKNQWLVSSGLAAGDRVIVEGLQVLQMLRPGVPVTVNATPFGAAESDSAKTYPAVGGK